MTPNDEPIKPIKEPATDAGAPEEPLEPPRWTLTAEDIAELEASTITLSDFIRELEARMG